MNAFAFTNAIGRVNRLNDYSWWFKFVTEMSCRILHTFSSKSWQGKNAICSSCWRIVYFTVKADWCDCSFIMSSTRCNVNAEKLDWIASFRLVFIYLGSNLVGKFTQSVRRIVQDVQDPGAPSKSLFTFVVLKKLLQQSFWVFVIYKNVGKYRVCSFLKVQKIKLSVFDTFKQVICIHFLF